MSDKAEVAIRPERNDEASVISGVIRRAFADIAYSDHREHLMVERLRRTDAFISSLSIVAEIAGEPAGHILLTRARILCGTSAVETLALAPLSVVPEHQRQGIGDRLIRAAHTEAKALGFGSIVLVGSPGYYSRFGYEPLKQYPIRLPFVARAEHCMIFPLVPHALDDISGVVEHAPGWLDH